VPSPIFNLCVLICLALDVLEIAKKSGASTIANLVAQTGLAKTLQTNENLTLFAPSDEAVAVSIPGLMFYRIVTNLYCQFMMKYYENILPLGSIYIRLID
jgi:hypothetical protein